MLGRYRLLEKVGGGGMGTVYKGLHVHLKQVVAIKTIKCDPQPDLIERFQREMEAIAAVQHLHVVRATDGAEKHGHYFLVMEYVEGTDLDKLVRDGGPLRPADACELIRQAALGLVCLHTRGWVHFNTLRVESTRRASRTRWKSCSTTSCPSGTTRRSPKPENSGSY